ncbi:MAG: VOC family protein [Burkholderiales bacterium]|nr:VOC family protein [Burkholderiales bacterium]
MKVVRVAHVAVATDALATLKSVFGDVLQLPLMKEARFPSGTEMAMFRLGNLDMEVVQNHAPDSLPGRFVREKGGGGYYHLCLEVDDLPGAVAELSARGVHALAGAPTRGAHGEPVVFLDPACTGGLMFELTQVYEHDAPATH